MNAVINVERLMPAWQSLQSVAAVTHIDSDEQYAQTTALLNSLLDVVRDDARHPLYSLVSVVGELIGPYLASPGDRVDEEHPLDQERFRR